MFLQLLQVAIHPERIEKINLMNTQWCVMVHHPKSMHINYLPMLEPTEQNRTEQNNNKPTIKDDKLVRPCVN